MSDTEEPWEVKVLAMGGRDLARIAPRYRDALIAFIFGGLAQDPKRRGKPLRGDLTGLWSARRGDFRVLYELDEALRVVHVVRVAGRAEAYRRLAED